MKLRPIRRAESDTRTIANLSAIHVVKFDAIDLKLCVLIKRAFEQRQEQSEASFLGFLWGVMGSV